MASELPGNSGPVYSQIGLRAIHRFVFLCSFEKIGLKSEFYTNGKIVFYFTITSSMKNQLELPTP